MTHINLNLTNTNFFVLYDNPFIIILKAVLKFIIGLM